MKATFICLALTSVLHCPFASAQWVHTNGPAGVDIRCLALSGPDLFAGTYGSGVYLSTNKGTTWTPLRTDLPPYKYINCLAVDGENVYAGTVSGVFVSSNNGANWSATTGVTGIDIHAFAVSGVNVFAGTWDYGAFLSTDHGRNWTAVNAGLPTDLLTVHSLASTGTTVFAGTEFGVFVSTNNGTKWIAACSGLTNSFILSLAVSGTNLFAGTYEGVFLSTDHGGSWDQVNAGFPLDIHGDYPLVHALAVSGMNVFAGTDGDGVFLSTDNGTSWNAVNNGLQNKYILNLAVDDTNLYTGNNSSGVWLRPLSEMIMTSVSGPFCELPAMFGLRQNYPNPFNPTTAISFQLPVASHVTLVVCDLLGRKVAVLVNGKRDAGVHEVMFDGSNFASGVYLYRLQAGDFVQSKKLLLLR
jgi:photosystem II stability/assembly factor-like uncharacterized protein